jgi:hypothetical protein
MTDKVLMWNTEEECYFSSEVIGTKKLSEASLVEKDFATEFYKNSPNINLIDLEEAFTSLQLQVRINK